MIPNITKTRTETLPKYAPKTAASCPRPTPRRSTRPDRAPTSGLRAARKHSEPDIQPSDATRLRENGRGEPRHIAFDPLPDIAALLTAPFVPLLLIFLLFPPPPKQGLRRRVLSIFPNGRRARPEAAAGRQAPHPAAHPRPPDLRPPLEAPTARDAPTGPATSNPPEAPRPQALTSGPHRRDPRLQSRQPARGPHTYGPPPRPPKLFKAPPRRRDSRTRPQRVVVYLLPPARPYVFA